MSHQEHDHSQADESASKGCCHHHGDSHAPAKKPAQGHGASEGAYICPMCPGVSSDKPDTCPKCGMALEPAQPASRTSTKYTCPMHPEIVRDEPGDCPICGMALEPMQVEADTGPSPELKDMTRRFVGGAVLTVPLVLLAMGELIPGVGSLVHGAWNKWVQLALATPVVLWAGAPFFQRGWKSVVTRNLNMFTLIAIGTGAAFLYSVAAVFAPGIFPAGFRGPDGSVGLYFEAAGVIITLVLLGQVLELRARERTSDALKALLDLAPKTARRIKEDGDDEEVPVSEIAVGDRLRIRPGESVPVDGDVVKGRSSVDESMITGESVPVEKVEGEKLIGGTLNGTGTLVMEAANVGSETMLSRIVQMVADAQRSRAPIQRLADSVAGYFVPAVILIAVLAFVTWGVWGLRSGGGGVRADHRLPLRARPRHADVDHGRHGARRPGRHLDQERGGAGAPGEGRYHRCRQDRHLDRRQAQADGGGADRRLGRGRSALPGGQPGARV